MNTKLVDLLIDLAMLNEFDTELRAKPDGIGFFSICINFINVRFTEILKKNNCVLISVEPAKIKSKLFATLQFRNE